MEQPELFPGFGSRTFYFYAEIVYPRNVLWWALKYIYLHNLLDSGIFSTKYFTSTGDIGAISNASYDAFLAYPLTRVTSRSEMASNKACLAFLSNTIYHIITANIIEYFHWHH